MLVYEYKLDASPAQYARLDEASRVGQFVRNTCLRLWMDGRGVSANDLQVFCSRLANDSAFAARLNSQARQAAADRAWQAISRFYANCREQRPGKKGSPQFRQHCRSVEYKQTGWKLDPDGRHLTFTDGCGIGRVRLVGTREIATFPPAPIKRVRLLRRADGYYAQCAVAAYCHVEQVPTGQRVGIDVGRCAYDTDSDGGTVDNPPCLRRAEQRLRLLSRRLSRTSWQRKQGCKPGRNPAARRRARRNTYPSAPRPRLAAPGPLQPQLQPQPQPQPQPRHQSATWHKARIVLARHHLTVQRQREEFARKRANALVSSHDLIALEDRQVRNLVRNRRLAKSISDAGWATFRRWVEYYGRVHGVPVVAVPPQYTSQVGSGCGGLVRKSLSVRTYVCRRCGLVLDRDHNAARNILAAALAALGGAVESAWTDDRCPVRRAPDTASGTVGHTGTSRLGTAGLLRSTARRAVAPAGGTKNLPALTGQSVKMELGRSFV
jgi:putative transposase